MKLTKKLLMDKGELELYGAINVVVFGDSVSHGALGDNEIDYETVYWNLLKRKINAVRNYVPVNVINASIGGTTAADSLARMDKQVFAHNPDLLIVCFGLNDVNGARETYLSALETIFAKSLSLGIDTIFMTPNMLNTYVAEDTLEELKGYAAVTADYQNSGKMDSYIYGAVEVAKKMGVHVCDCYSQWKELGKTQDTTKLLANRINHPTREMHELFAQGLFDVIFQEKVENTENASTMYEVK